MKMLIFSLGAVAVGLCVHLVTWRVSLPRAQTTALLKIFAGVYVLALGLSLVPALRAIAPNNLLEAMHFTVFFVPTFLAYTSFYSLIEHNSPSIAIVSAAASAPAGCTRDELVAAIGGDSILGQRLEAASGNGLIEQRDQHWVLTAKGRVFARLFDQATRLYRLDRSG